MPAWPPQEPLAPSLGYGMVRTATPRMEHGVRCTWRVVLLALLVVVNAYWPAPPPIAERADAEVPVIRIHSERKWPQPVVFDTSHPTIAPAQPVQIAKTEAAQTENAAPAADAPAK